jgi:hypothetical protein
MKPIVTLTMNPALDISLAVERVEKKPVALWGPATALSAHSCSNWRMTGHGRKPTATLSPPVQRL